MAHINSFIRKGAVYIAVLDHSLCLPIFSTFEIPAIGGPELANDAIWMSNLHS